MVISYRQPFPLQNTTKEVKHDAFCLLNPYISNENEIDLVAENYVFFKFM